MTEAQAKSRMDFLDILKGLACIWMVHRHVWNALIDQNEKIPSYYPDYLIGMAAPSFLISAGFVFIILFDSAQMKNEVNKRMKRLLYRCAQVIALGYALQLPYFSLRKMLFNLTLEQKKYFFHANVLQCIGISLILLSLFIYLLKRINIIYASYLAGIIGLIIIFSSPWVWEHANFPIYFQSYFTFKTLSLFPIFPFSGILFLGAPAAAFYMQMKRKNKILMAFIIFTILGLFLMLTRWLHFIQQPFLNLGNANPLIYLYKLGQGLFFLGISYFLEKITGIFKFLIEYITLMGKEALFFYAFHLALVYGSPLNTGLYKLYAGSLSLNQVLLLGLLILIISLLFTILWHQLKKKFFYAPKITIGLIALIFIFKPF